MGEISNTSRNFMKALAIILAFVYVMSSTTSPNFVKGSYTTKILVANVIGRWVLFLPVTVFGGIISSMVDGAFIGFTIFQLSVALIIKFFIYAVLLYYYYYAIATVIIKKFGR